MRPFDTEIPNLLFIKCILFDKLSRANLLVSFVRCDQLVWRYSHRMTIDYDFRFDFRSYAMIYPTWTNLAKEALGFPRIRFSPIFACKIYMFSLQTDQSCYNQHISCRSKTFQFNMDKSDPNW